MKLAKMLLSLTVLVLVAATVSAQDAPKKGDHKGFHGGPIDRILAAKDLNLTDDQKSKLQDLKKTAGDPGKQFDSILTDDQKKARDDAVKAAKDAGKKGRDVMQAGMKAVTLTDDQKAQVAKAHKEFADKISAILTPEQNDKVKALLGGGHHHGDKKQQ